MKKVNNQTTTNKAEIYVESKTMRDEAIETCDVDFLDKIKAVQYLTEDMVLTIDQAAFYYESSRDSVSTIIKRNREEFETDGMVVLTGQELKNFKETLKGSIELSKVNKSLILLTKRSLLRVGMIMTNNAMANKIRNYLLNLEEVSTREQKQWAIQREVGKIERKRMTTAISKYIPETAHKKFAYPNYTNMLYTVLFGKTAKELRISRNVKDNDALRDSFQAYELSLVEEGETIITALIALGFEFEQIKIQLNNKFTPQLMNSNKDKY